jgi:hypothetical protein
VILSASERLQKFNSLKDIDMPGSVTKNHMGKEKRSQIRINHRILGQLSNLYKSKMRSQGMRERTNGSI